MRARLILLFVAILLLPIDARSIDGTYNRNVLQFGSLIMGAMGNPFGYNGYGCWCGKGNRGRLVVDETDRCCQIHDLCWEIAERRTAGCKPFWRWYAYDKPDGQIECTDPKDTCDRDTCLCDKAAVECFARNRTTYSSDIDNWEGNCDRPADSTEQELQECPPVWESDMAYRGGSYVSVNGVAYRAFYWADRGRNPKKNSATHQSSGAMWQKLGPCRTAHVDSDPVGAMKEALAIVGETNELEETELLLQLEQLFTDQVEK